MVDIGLTRYAWLNWFCVALLIGMGWTLGSAIMAALLALLSRGG